MEGDLHAFGLEQLILGNPVTDQALFLEGMLPLGDGNLSLSAVELVSGTYVLF